MTAAIVVILIAGALLGLYLWSKRAGAGAPPLGSLPPGDGVRGIERGAAKLDNADAQRATLTAAGGWRVTPEGVYAIVGPLVTRAPTNAEKLSGILTRRIVSSGIAFFQGATGWTGGAPPAGHATYPDVGGAVLVGPPPVDVADNPAWGSVVGGVYLQGDGTVGVAKIGSSGTDYQGGAGSVGTATIRR